MAMAPRYKMWPIGRGFWAQLVSRYKRMVWVKSSMPPLVECVRVFQHVALTDDELSVIKRLLSSATNMVLLMSILGSIFFIRKSLTLILDLMLINSLLCVHYSKELIELIWNMSCEKNH